MLTSTKVGKELGLTKGTICTLARQGRIPFIQLPSGHRRFDLEAVKAALSSDTMASTFLRPISDCNEDERQRHLYFTWKSMRRQYEALAPVEEGSEEANRRSQFLAKLDAAYERDAGVSLSVIGHSYEKGGA